MRRPFDFWKGSAIALAAEPDCSGLAIAQLLFICVYMVFGEVVYALQGQFTLALAYQGIGPYSGQTVCNVFALITGLLAVRSTCAGCPADPSQAGLCASHGLRVRG